MSTSVPQSAVIEAGARPALCHPQCTGLRRLRALGPAHESPRVTTALDCISQLEESGSRANKPLPAGRDKQRDRQTYAEKQQRDRQTHTHTKRHTERENRERQRRRETERHTERERDRVRERDRDGETERQKA